MDLKDRLVHIQALMRRELEDDLPLNGLLGMRNASKRGKKRPRAARTCIHCQEVDDWKRDCSRLKAGITSGIELNVLETNCSVTIFSTS